MTSEGDATRGTSDSQPVFSLEQLAYINQFAETRTLALDNSACGSGLASSGSGVASVDIAATNPTTVRPGEVYLIGRLTAAVRNAMVVGSTAGKLVSGLWWASYRWPTAGKLSSASSGQAVVGPRWASCCRASCHGPAPGKLWSAHGGQAVVSPQRESCHRPA